MLVLPEERVEQLETFAGFFQKLLMLERTLASTPSGQTPDLTNVEWGWLRAFDDVDLGEFVADLRRALLLAINQDRADLLDEVLQRWRATARSLDDPLGRRILLEPIQSGDFVEVTRPGHSAA